MARQIQVADDLRVEERNRVCRHGVAKAGMKFLGDGGAADDVASFENGDFQASRRQVGGADESVVAAADDQRVTGAVGLLRYRHMATIGVERLRNEHQHVASFVRRRLAGISLRMRRAKLRRHTSFSLSGPTV